MRPPQNAQRSALDWAPYVHAKLQAVHHERGPTGRYIIADRPMTGAEWIRERATVIDTPETLPAEIKHLQPLWLTSPNHGAGAQSKKSLDPVTNPASPPSPYSRHFDSHRRVASRDSTLLTFVARGSEE